MLTNNQNNDFFGNFTPITSFLPNRLVVTNANGYAVSSDISIEKLETIVQYAPTIFVSNPIATTTFTNAYLNNIYSINVYPIGSTFKYTSLVDMPDSTALVTRIGANTWDLNLTTIKLT